MNNQKMYQRVVNSEPNPLSLITNKPVGDGVGTEKNKKKKSYRKKKGVGNPSQSSASSVASPASSHGCKVSIVLRVKNSQKLTLSSDDGVSDHNQNSLSFGMLNSSVKISNQGWSDEFGCNSFPKDAVPADSNRGLVFTENESRIGCTENGKENRSFAGIRRHYNAGQGQVNWVKKSRHRNGVGQANSPENHFWRERNSLDSDAPVKFSGHNNTVCGYKNFERRGRMPQRVLNESSQRADSPQRLNGKLNVSQLTQMEGLENETERVVGRSADAIKLVHFGVTKGPHSYTANFSGLGDKGVSYNKELLQDHSDMQLYKSRDAEGRNCQKIASPSKRHCLGSPSGYSKIPTQGLITGMQKYIRKIPSMEQEFGKPPSVSMDNIQCCHNDHKIRQDTSGANKKQCAISTSEFKLNEGMCSANICRVLNCDLQDSNTVLDNCHLGGSWVSSSPPILDNKDPKLYQSATERGQKIDRKGYDAVCKRPNETVQFIIGSEMAMKALRAAYQVQLESETVQLALRCPLAEFERFIHCAAPVIPTPFVHKCSVSLDAKPSRNLLCKHQIPNISLHTVWDWYEKPGNYGLAVKEVCSNTVKGSPNDSFDAHFVPSLSAIQLFVPCIPGSVEHNHIRVGSVDVSLRDGSGPLNLACSAISSADADLVFEFFDSDLPFHRKPFYNKILELIGAETSDSHIFGDPAKLNNLNLHDLHPASWFSVAWYPIYRIPDGSLRVSFLTYHSLGHFVQRSGSTDAPENSPKSFFLPVLGLQSYNSQGECWFETNGPSSKEPTSFNIEEILKQRCRMLEENALQFARGWVCKDKIMVQNRHPDYEFFMSRKTRPK